MGPPNVRDARRDLRLTPGRTHGPDTPPDGTLPLPSGLLLAAMEANSNDCRRCPPAAPPRADGQGRPEPTFAPPPTIAIGEIDQTIFDCPSCSRPLALGAHRCPGCGTRLVSGVPLGKASGFIALGLVIGLVAGGGGGLIFGIANASAFGAGPAAAPSTAAAPGGSSEPAASAGPRSTASAPTSTAAPTLPVATEPAGIPSVIRSALVQVIATNDRLAGDAAGLRAALAASTFDASAVAQILRSVSADTIFAEQLAARVEGWSDSSAVGTQLATFYGALHDAASDGLVASVQNKAAYHAAATAMVGLLAGIPAVDAAVRSVATDAGIDLPSPSAAPSRAPSGSPAAP